VSVSSVSSHSSPTSASIRHGRQGGCQAEFDRVGRQLVDHPFESQHVGSSEQGRSESSRDDIGDRLADELGLAAICHRLGGNTSRQPQPC